jgi:hypothetical protein
MIQLFPPAANPLLRTCRCVCMLLSCFFCAVHMHFAINMLPLQAEISHGSRSSLFMTSRFSRFAASSSSRHGRRLYLFFFFTFESGNSRTMMAAVFSRRSAYTNQTHMHYLRLPQNIKWYSHSCIVGPVIGGIGYDRMVMERKPLDPMAFLGNAWWCWWWWAW